MANLLKKSGILEKNFKENLEGLKNSRTFASAKFKHLGPFVYRLGREIFIL